MTKVLLVDDDDGIRDGMSELLGVYGVETYSAANGNEATKQLAEHRVDVVVLDIFMPEKDGLETISDIRANYGDVKIIAMSGYAQTRFDPLEFAKELGADIVLNKPFSADEFLTSLKTVAPQLEL